MTVRKQGCAALAIFTVTSLMAAGCSQQTSVGRQTPETPAPSSSTDSGAAAEPTAKPRNDLKGGSVQKNFRSGGLTINVTYSSTLPTSQWGANTSKPLNLSLSAINNDKDMQKIYLSKVIMSVLATDSSGQLGNPVNVTDTANISPGYIVNFPYTYEQNFTVPAVDQSASSVTLTFNYELLSQVQKDSRDYAKQTATNTIKVPLS